MNHRHLLGTAIFLALTLGLVLFLSRDRGGQAPEPRTAPPPGVEGAAGTEPDAAPETGDPSSEPASAATSPDPAPAPTRLPVEQFATKKVALRLEGADAGEALETFLAPLGYEVSFSDTAWTVAEDIDVHLQLDDVSVKTVLALMLEPYELTWKVEDGVLWVLLPGEEPPESVR